MKKIIFLLVLGCLALGNHAGAAINPYLEGTLSGSIFPSPKVEVIEEHIRITLDSDFQTAEIVMEYLIRSDEAVQIPLLYWADSPGSELVAFWDEVPIDVSEIPAAYPEPIGTPFEDFAGIYDPPKDFEQADIYISTGGNRGYYLDFNELYYFEVDSLTQDHKFTLSYTATCGISLESWIKEHDVRFSFSPREFWSTDAPLRVTLNAAQFSEPIVTNLGEPTTGEVNELATWEFEHPPATMIEISAKAEVSKIASFFMTITPAGMTAVLALLVLLLHFYFIFRWRKKHPTKRFSWVAIVGSILLPIPVLSAWILFFAFIDVLIGAEATGNHGFTLVIFILYPILTPLYLIIAWLTDWLYMRRLAPRDTSLDL